MKKILCISLLLILLTGCGNKTKEDSQKSLGKEEQEQLEKAEENVYSVMSSIMVEYQLSKLDSEPITLPFTVSCNEKDGCTGSGKKLDLEVVPKSGTFTLKDETLIFESTSDIIMESYSCSINEKNVVVCKK